MGITHILNNLASPNISSKQICNLQEIDEIYCVLVGDNFIELLDIKLHQIRKH